jgi:hypothetical protein
LNQVGFIADSKYWGERAAEMRALAEQVKKCRRRIDHAYADEEF